MTRDYASTAHGYAGGYLVAEYKWFGLTPTFRAAEQVQPTMTNRYGPLAHAYREGFGDAGSVKA